MTSESVVPSSKPADVPSPRTPSAGREEDHAGVRALIEALRSWAGDAEASEATAGAAAPGRAAPCPPVGGAGGMPSGGVGGLERLVAEDSLPVRPVLHMLRDLVLEVDRARARAEASERELRELVESLDGVVWRAEFEEAPGSPSPRRYLFVSGRAGHLLGVEAARWVEDPGTWLSLIHPQDRERVVATCRAHAGRDQDYELEYRMVSAAGETRWVRERIHVVRDAGGRPCELRGLLEDVTEARHATAALREREEHRRQTQKMEALRRLATGLAHGLGNSLAAIKLRADLLLMGAADPAAVRSQARAILEAAEEAGALTRELLAFGRRRPTRRVPVDLAGLLSDLRETLDALVGERIELGLEVGLGLWRTVGDPAQLRRAILTLVGRARQAMPEGGRLVIRCDNRWLTEGRAGVPAGAWVVVEVSDNGPGLDPDSRARLFEPFLPGQDRGSGLGLFTVDSIVRQHAGSIEVESEPGRGTTIRLYLPRLEEEPGTGPGRGGETILLVEDDPALRGLITCVLEQEGYRVLAAASGAEAEQLVTKGGPVDLLLADVGLPGMSGHELAARLSALAGFSRVMYMSGDGDRAGLPGADPHGPPPVLQKPFTLDALSRAVRRALQGAGS